MSLGATLAVMTDYVSRGLSQTDRDPAAQATLELSYSAGPPVFQPFLGIFAGNVNFPGADSEVDPYIGTRGTAAGVAYELVAIYYAYPDARSELKFQFFEYGASLSHPWPLVTPTIGILYSPNFFADSGKQFYPFVSARVPFRIVGHEWGVTGRFSRRMIEHNERFGLPDYNAWTASLDTTVHGFTFSVAYTDTNVPLSVCPTKICDPGVVFQIAKRF